MSLFDSLRWLAETGEAFTAGVRAKLDEAGRGVFGGPPGQFVKGDQSARFKDLLANASLFDSELLARTPANPTWRCDFNAGVWGRLTRGRTRVIGVVAVDLAEVVRRFGGEASGGQPPSAVNSQGGQPPSAVSRLNSQSGAGADWPPLSADGLEEVLRELRGRPRRTFVGVCSPSGFAPEAVERARRKAAMYSARGGGLVLVSARRDGGWVVTSLEAGAVNPKREEGGQSPFSQTAAKKGTVPAPAWHFVFDPEPIRDKMERVGAAVGAAGLELAEGGLNDRELANRLEVPLELVRQVFAAEAGRGVGLRVRDLDGDQVLLGSTDLPSTSRRATSMFGKLRELLGLRGQEQKKIEVLADKRALLASRRDRLYRELDELGEKEQSLRERGVAADSAVVQRRFASELAQVRRRIEQAQAVVNLFNRQIDILSAHVHHLTLITQGQAVAMPDVEEMTRDAVRAEELIERVKGDSELVESLAEATGISLSSKQEEAILAEFAAARSRASRPQAEKEKPDSAEPQAGRDAGGRERDRGQPMKE